MPDHGDLYCVDCFQERADREREKVNFERWNAHPDEARLAAENRCQTLERERQAHLIELRDEVEKLEIHAGPRFNPIIALTPEQVRSEVLALIDAKMGR